MRSAASSAVRACRAASAPTAPRVGRPIRGQGVDITDVSDRTRCGCSIATVWAIMPPIDVPNRCADSQPSASSTATASAAMSRPCNGATARGRGSTAGSDGLAELVQVGGAADVAVVEPGRG